MGVATSRIEPSFLTELIQFLDLRGEKLIHTWISSGRVPFYNKSEFTELILEVCLSSDDGPG